MARQKFCLVDFFSLVTKKEKMSKRHFCYSTFFPITELTAAHKICRAVIIVVGMGLLVPRDVPTLLLVRQASNKISLSTLQQTSIVGS